MTNGLEKVVILGGGFTGLFTALYLRDGGYSGPITLIDRETRFIFRPLLYDLLSREVQVDMVWPQYDELLLPKEVTFVSGEVIDVDVETQIVTLDSGLTYEYDYLVMALGSTTGYFDVPGAQDHSFPFRSAEDAFELGKHARSCLQQASQDAKEQERLRTFSIVGAGPSGIELAATLGDLLPAWYENLQGNVEDLRIVILQRGKDILQSTDSPDVRETAREFLANRRISIDLILDATVTSVTKSGIDYIKDEKFYHLPSQTVIWTTGNVVNPLIANLPLDPACRDHHNRLKAEPTLQLIHHPHIFVGGDCAVLANQPQPETAQVAYQAGQAIAQNIIALSQGQSLAAADINLRGTLLKLGMNTGVASIFDQYEVTGYPAHLIRQAIYLNLLPTPARNLKHDAQWFTEEIFEQVLSA